MNFPGVARVPINRHKTRVCCFIRRKGKQIMYHQNGEVDENGRIMACAAVCRAEQRG